jgi:hypothetical protein
MRWSSSVLAAGVTWLSMRLRLAATPNQTAEGTSSTPSYRARRRDEADDSAHAGDCSPHGTMEHAG